MQKVLLSAYACDPTKGSEAGNGFNWAKKIAELGYEVYCLTTVRGQSGIRSESNLPSNLKFVFVEMPSWLNTFYYKSTLGMYLHYLYWQWRAYKKAKQLHKEMTFDLAHHVTWGSIQQGSFLYKLNVPFIFGPAGGGQASPRAFQKYFHEHWSVEVKREKMSMLLQRLNPACKPMIRKAKVVLATNNDTLLLAQRLGGQKVVHVFDAALPKTFFPEMKPEVALDQKELRLLWVGRFLPRKGILLVLEVMEKLKQYPNITLTVVGDGEMKELFLASMEAKQLHKQVTWTGKVPFSEVKKYYENHDAFLFTSLRDSSPAQLIEAMAYGLPIITLDLHGQGLMVNSERGFKASIENPTQTIEELVAFIIKLYKDRELLRNLSKAAYTFSLKQTWDQKIKHIVGTYYQE